MYYKIIASEVYVSQSLVASHYYILIKNMTMIDSNSSVMMMMMKMMMAVVVVVVVVVVVMIIIPTQPYISSFIICSLRVGEGASWVKFYLNSYKLRSE